MNRIRNVAVGIALVCTLTSVAAVPALAVDSSTAGVTALSANAVKSLKRLESLNEGVTEQELVNNSAAYARSEGISTEKALAVAVAEAEASERAASAAQNGGGKGRASLGPGKRKGDVFVSPASTLFIKHGHTGIYYSSSWFVEAPGKKANGVALKSKKTQVKGYSVGKGAVKQSVSTSTSKRNASANHAHNKLRGKKYNSNFAFNKNVNGEKMNCSQLVWAAYKVGAKVDLDGNGGPGVYPYNIKNSKHTKTYQTL